MPKSSETLTSDIVIPELIDDFRELTELNLFMQSTAFNGATEFKRDELANSIGERLVGRRIEVVELPIARETRERAIEHISIANTMQIVPLAKAVGVYNSNRRRHPITGREYVRHDSFRYRRHTTMPSKVEGIDKVRSSIVARPRLALFDRAWIKVVRADGEQLVDITIAD
jgi:hypothetical protein